MFGSDEFADFGNVPVFRFDAGADSYEQMQFLISTYENRYIFNNFRRNLVTFNTGARRRAYRAALLGQGPGDQQEPRARHRALTVPGGPIRRRIPGPSCRGARLGRRLRDVRARAHAAGPGPYVVTQPSRRRAAEPVGPGVAARRPASPNAPPSSLVNVALGNGQGRFHFNDYDYSQGYWWSEYQKQVGSYYEKVDAFEYLLQAYNDFVSNSPEDYIDGRYKNLNYASLYPDQVRRLLANVMVAQSPTPVARPGADGADLHRRALLDAGAASTVGNANPLTDGAVPALGQVRPDRPDDRRPSRIRRARCSSIRSSAGKSSTGR